MRKYLTLCSLLFATVACAQEAPTPQATGPQATLAWTDNSSNETGFVVEQKCAAETTFTRIATTAANATTYVAPLNSAQAGQTCTFRVAAFNSAGQSAFSNEASCTVPQQALTAPTNLTAGAQP